MREILFRGKVKDGYKWIEKGEWIEGNLFYSDDENGTVCWIATSYLSGNKDESVMVVAYEVDPETVCQYTGMHDNTKWEQLSESEQNRFLQEWNTKEDGMGRKIFEGDIVDSDGSIGVVKFGKYKNGFHYGYYIEWLKCPDLRQELGYWNGISKVIGNIFDNPELMGLDEVGG